jgi:hypothetical protein
LPLAIPAVRAPDGDVGVTFAFAAEPGCEEFAGTHFDDGGSVAGGVGMGSVTNSAVCARSGAASMRKVGIRRGGFILARGFEANIGSVAGRGKGFAFCGLGHEIGFVRHFVFSGPAAGGRDL